MDNYEEELRTKWNSINYQSGGSLQLAIEHPLEWHVMYASPEHKSLIIVSDEPAGDIVSSKSIETGCNMRKDGKYAISFTLMDQNQEDVFITMSRDIIGYSSVECSKTEEALNSVLKRYAAWMKLLDHKHNSVLPLSAQKGLIGELLFLKERIESGMDIAEAVSGWSGPDGEDQDFYYEDKWYEIKSTGRASSSVTISSIEQLDNNDIGELVIYRIDKCPPTRTGAFTLYQLVHTLFDFIGHDAHTQETFVLKLGSMGYIDMIEYDKQNYVFSSKQEYFVDDSFPKFRREDIPTEIINTEYQLSIQSINKWKK